jgi:hypothetical protein
LESAITSTLSGLTLADLVNRQRAMDHEPPYCPPSGR